VCASGSGSVESFAAEVKHTVGDVGQVKLRGPSINFALVLVVRLLYRSS
jgi:hypothetical protein